MFVKVKVADAEENGFSVALHLGEFAGAHGVEICANGEGGYVADEGGRGLEKGVEEDAWGNGLLLAFGWVEILVSSQLVFDEGVEFVVVDDDRVYPGMNGEGIIHMAEQGLNGDGCQRSGVKRVLPVEAEDGEEGHG